MALVPDHLVPTVTQQGTDVGALRTRVGTAALVTVATNLSSAVNELKGEIDTLSGGGVVGTLDDLTDVVITAPATGHTLRHDGTNFVNVTTATLLGANLTALDVASSTYGRTLLNLPDVTALRTEVGASSTTVAGLIETSTSAEGIAGTDDARAVTPKVMADTLSANLSAVAFSGSATDITTGTLPTSVLPALAITDTSVVATEADMILLTAQRGDVAVITGDGTSRILATDDPTQVANWVPLPAIGAVVSVAGQQGVVTLGKGDVGLANVDNTSDANKPISTATQTALDTKQAEHANLDEVSGLTLIANRLVQTDETGALSLITVTADARALVSHNFADMRTDLSVYSQAQIGDVDTDLLAAYVAARDA